MLIGGTPKTEIKPIDSENKSNTLTTDTNYYKQKHIMIVKL